MSNLHIMPDLNAPEQPGELYRLRLQSLQLQQALSNEGKVRGFVLDRYGDRIIVSLPQGTAEVGIPTGFVIEVGDQVEMLGKTLGVLRTLDASTSTGPIERVVRLIDERHIEVTSGPTTRVVLRGRHARTVEAGDRVLLDNEGRMAIRKLPREDDGKPPPENPGVDWEDIVGQDEAVAALREAVEGPLQDPGGYERYGLKSPRGAMLSGPPGVGKTLLARAVATSIARLKGSGKTAQGLISVKGPEVLNPLVGKSEMAIRDLFDQARAHKKRHGYPATIFLDEADALLMKRGSRAFEGIERTIVPTFLAEMDGFEPSSAFVLVATNRPDMLDPAVTREGRLDLKIVLKRPDQQACEYIIERRLRGCPTSGGAPGYFAALAAEHMFAPRHALYMVRRQKGEDRRITLADLVSGAMCDAVVARAKGLAVRRERDDGAPNGLCETDIAKAVDAVVAEQRTLSHEPDVAEMVGIHDIKEIRKIRDDEQKSPKGRIIEAR